MPDPDEADGDYYAVLGVAPDADVAAIRAAYRERVKETHPDRNDAPDAAEQFQRVRRAEAVLTDPDERARYDRLGHERYVGAGPADATADTADEETTAARSRSRSRRQRARWTAEGWADPTGTATGGGVGASTTGPRETASPGGATRDGTARPVDLGHRITAAARTLERYRFDMDPTTAVFGLATFFVYPVFLASSFTPEFPLVVNVVLLCCLFCTLGYLLATPEVGIPVFGAWSLFGPVLFVFADRPLLSWAGFFLLAVTVVPFGLSVAIMNVLREN